MPETSLPLFAFSDEEKKQEITLRTDRQGTKGLWMAVHFPELALEIFSEKDEPPPDLIIKKSGSTETVYLYSPRLKKHGIKRGMLLSAALSLCPDLQIHEFNPDALRKKLEEMASWALQFTPYISVETPESLLMEIQGSLHYFGGMEQFKKKIGKAIEIEWGYSFHTATTPAPAASLLLARSSCSKTVRDISSLRSVLGSLPVHSLAISEKKKNSL